MFVTFGEKLFGVVDRVPGHFYVATPFLHFCEFPVFPGRSYLVQEGSQVDPTLFRKGSFAGYSIYWSLKSIAMAWFRGLLGILSLVAAVTALGTYLVYFNDKKDIQYLYTALIATASIFPFLAVYVLSLRLAMASRGRLAALAQRLEAKYPKAAFVVQSYLDDSEPDSLAVKNGQE
jgi:hypothetical protein